MNLQIGVAGLLVGGFLNLLGLLKSLLNNDLILGGMLLTSLVFLVLSFLTINED